jgi:hypothetical protein
MHILQKIIQPEQLWCCSEVFLMNIIIYETKCRNYTTKMSPHRKTLNFKWRLCYVDEICPHNMEVNIGHQISCPHTCASSHKVSYIYCHSSYFFKIYLQCLNYIHYRGYLDDNKYSSSKLYCLLTSSVFVPSINAYGKWRCERLLAQANLEDALDNFRAVCIYWCRGRSYAPISKNRIILEISILLFGLAMSK